MTPPDDALFSMPDDGGSAAVLLHVAELAERLGVLEDLLLKEPDLAGYQPIPAPKWWLLDGDERAEAIDRLAAWVDQVYRPSYGHLARQLPACWPEHPVCLFLLDFLCELHSLLYLRARRGERTLASQAEWHIRHLPAVADLMAAESRGCPHSKLPRTPVNGAVR